MHKCLRFFSLLFVLSTGSLFAYVHPCPGNWAVDAEFLYLFPTFDDTYFVISGTAGIAFPNGKRENNEFDFHPGFRVGAAYAFCDCNRDFQAYYTRLRATETETITGNGLWATIGQPDFTSNFQGYIGSATSELDIFYQRVDGFFSQQVWCCCGLDLNLLAGLEYAYVRFNEDYTYLTATPVLGNVRQRAKTWGVGPQFGVDVSYAISQFACFCPGNLSVVATTSGSLLVSRAHESAFNRAGATIFLDVNDEHTWRIVPALHARVGLNYATCFSCFGLSLEVGYEFNSYIRALSRMAFVDDIGEATSYNNYINFDVQGLYVAAAFTF